MVDHSSMNRISLIYTSAVCGDGPTLSELATLLRSASLNNARLGVSGILCYARGKFLQALEGERSVVNALYRRILQDARHQKCEIVSCSEISAYQFAEWSMRHVALDMPFDCELDELGARDAKQYLLECASRERSMSHGAALAT